MNAERLTLARVLVEAAERAGVELRVRGADQILAFPGGVLPANLRALIRQHRTAVAIVLRGDDRPAGAWVPKRSPGATGWRWALASMHERLASLPCHWPADLGRAVGERARAALRAAHEHVDAAARSCELGTVDECVVYGAIADLSDVLEVIAASLPAREGRAA